MCVYVGEREKGGGVEKLRYFKIESWKEAIWGIDFAMHSLKKKKSALVNSLPILELSEDFDFAKEMVCNWRQSACFLQSGIGLS